jgi:predicted nucleotidyltransferase
MSAQPRMRDWSVTPEKVDEAVRRIVATADPLQIIMFGSRARGDYRPDSDLDLAVILDGPESEVNRRLSYSVLEGIHMSVDLIVVSKEKYDRFRPWLNSVFNYIDQEGVVLYDRDDPESARGSVMHAGAGRRVGASVSAA